MSSDIHALSGAYAANAVDDIERAQFERHLAGCDDCRLEVGSLREAAALLAEVVAQPAPPALRAQVLSKIEMVRPLPPLSAGAQARGRARRIPTMIAAAAALVVIGGVGTTVWHPWEQPTSDLTAAQLENAADAQVMTQKLAGGGAITLTRSQSLNSAYVAMRSMPRLQSDQTYQLWSIHDGVPVSAGLANGDASKVLLEGDTATAQAIAITIEPAGGVETPSTDFIVASFDLAEA